jgi:hypothetical protein
LDSFFLYNLIDFLAKINIHFLNLNELEYSDTNAIMLKEQGYKTKDAISYAIKGSHNLAINLLSYIEKNYPKMNVHYCTAKLKDHVQMRNRIKHRAKSIKQPFDRLSEDGTLIRGSIYLNELYPSKNYKEKLRKLSSSKRKYLESDLKELKKILKKEFNLKHLELDKDKLRLLTSEKEIKFLAKKIEPTLFKLAVVEEYPTYDAFQVEVEFL